MLKTLGRFKIEEVLPFKTTEKIRRPYKIKGGRTYEVWMDSERYQVFSKSRTCSCCGLEGTYFLLQCNPPEEGEIPKYGHFNLFGEDPEFGQVLLTKDHITPKSKGGGNGLDNYQTMCQICNSIKSNKSLSFVQVLVERKRLLEKKQDPEEIKKKQRKRKQMYFKAKAVTA